jgi:hypothetical protein
MCRAYPPHPRPREGAAMAYYRITLFSNQRDPIRKWSAPSRVDAGNVVASECVEREKMGGFFIVHR